MNSLSIFLQLKLNKVRLSKYHDKHSESKITLRKKGELASLSPIGEAFAVLYYK